MKKIFSIILSLTFVLIVVSCFTTANAETPDTFTRVVNVVYDDSGSMVWDNGRSSKPIDRWCKAKYSMEVFASMLSESDTMNIFVMSDFDNKGTSSKKCQITINGSDDLETNVQKIHSMKTMSGNTPFLAVESAYDDLTQTQADEKWLVVLTDGEFQNNNGSKKGNGEVNKFFNNKDSDIKVMFFSMGSSAATISSNEDKNIFTKKAKSSDDILTQVTDISVQVFNLHKLDDGRSGVPMSDLIVFSQGKKVKLNGIKDKNGKKIGGHSQSANIKYSEYAKSKGDGTKFDDNLIGKIIKYTGDYDAGTYSVDITGNRTTEVYYKPNVSVAASLYDKNGKEVTNKEKLQAGKYKIEFGLVKKGTNKKVNSNQLNEQYSASLLNNGKQIASNIENGDTINIDEGRTVIDVTATFFEYNTIRNTLEYDIFKNKEIVFDIIDSQKYNVDSNGIKNENEPIIVKATIDGREFSKTEWAKFKIPNLSVEDVKEEKYGFKIEKADEVGTLKIYPTLPNGKPTVGTYENINVTLSYKDTIGDSKWTGKKTIKVKFFDGRSWLEQNYDNIIKAVIALSVILLTLGYIPPFKKYLPKEIASKPKIKCKPVKYGKKPTDSFGNYKKNIRTTLCPYMAERGSIRFIPMGVSGVSSASVKAAGGGMMYITNYKAFEKNANVAFDGQKFKDGEGKHMRFSSGLNIKTTTKQFVYICTLTK